MGKSLTNFNLHKIPYTLSLGAQSSNRNRHIWSNRQIGTSGQIGTSVNRLLILIRRIGNHVLLLLLFGVFFLEVSVMLTRFGFERVGCPPLTLDRQCHLAGRQNNLGIQKRSCNLDYSHSLLFFSKLLCNSCILSIFFLLLIP